MTAPRKDRPRRAKPAYPLHLRLRLQALSIVHAVNTQWQEV